MTPPDRSVDSVFEVFAAGGAAGITGQKAEDENADEEENDRVNGDLEGEHESVRRVTGSDRRQVGPERPFGSRIILWVTDGRDR